MGCHVPANMFYFMIYRQFGRNGNQLIMEFQYHIVHLTGEFTVGKTGYFTTKSYRNLLKTNNQDIKQEKASLVKSLSHNIIPRRVEENKKIGGVAIENNARYLHFPLTL